MSQKFYKSANEIPLFNWVKCIEEQFRYILIQEDESITDQECKEAFELIHAKYIDEVGLNGELLKIAKLVQKKGLLLCDRVITGDKFLNTKLNLIELEIQKIKNSMNSNTATIEDIIATLSKHFGYFIDWKICTKTQFDALMKKYSNDNKNVENG